MGEYIFRFPADMPELTYDGLTAYIGDGFASRKIGTTVTAEKSGSGYVRVQLYDTVIALVYFDRVRFPGPDHPSQATTAWLARIIQDNGIDSGCWRVRRRKADGPGPYVARGRAGLLVLAGSAFDQRREVFGQSYPVDYEAVARRRAYLARWADFKAGNLTWDQAFAGAEV
jgi:hypothetical protein